MLKNYYHQLKQNKLCQHKESGQPSENTTISSFDYYNGIARITINRERYRNAFTPTTTAEMSDALRICREEADIDVIVITGAGDKAFCSGGDQNVKGRGGYIGKTVCLV